MCKCNPFKYKVCLCSVNSIHRYNEDYHELKTTSKCISIFFPVAMEMLTLPD